MSQHLAPFTADLLILFWFKNILLFEKKNSYDKVNQNKKINNLKFSCLFSLT